MPSYKKEVVRSISLGGFFIPIKICVKSTNFFQQKDGQEWRAGKSAAELETFCDNFGVNTIGYNGNIIFAKGTDCKLLYRVKDAAEGVKNGILGETRPENGEFSTLSTGFSTTGENAENGISRLT